MANAINIPKTHLIMGLSLPDAMLLGCFVAEPTEPGGLAVGVLVTSMQPGVIPYSPVLLGYDRRRRI